MAVFLAAQAHGAKQIMGMCEYWMAMELAEAEKHEQWSELSEEVRTRLRRENERLQAEKARMRDLEQMPCMLTMKSLINESTRR